MAMPTGRTGPDDVRWEGTCRSRWGLPMAAVLVVVAAWNAVAGELVLAVLLLGTAYAGALFASIRVSVSGDAVRVRYRWGWTRRVALGDVQGTAVDELVPWRWGGWGYRGGLRVFGKAAILLRGGEAIRLDLVGGRQLFIGVDDAAGAMAALDALRGAAGPPPSGAPIGDGPVG
ncbi:MAG: hypothetical protein MUF83_04940 [Acidimicrobiales bacterium]|nr:hypothetical protein [Acidimicrobiales bacterium]